MWWVNKFGSVSGPYTDEQIRNGIRQFQFTRLCKLSSDGRNWRFLQESEFWNPISSAPQQMEIPPEFVANGYEPANPSSKASGLKATAAASSKSMTAAGGTRKSIALIVGGIVAVVLGVLVLRVFSAGKEIKKNEGGATFEFPVASKNLTSSAADFESIKKCIVLVHTKTANGTAFLVKMNGRKYVLTNEHVIRGDSIPEMVLVDGTKLTLGKLSVAKDRDLARFEVLHDGHYLELSEKIPNNNDEIWVYGNSLGDGVITSLRGFVTGVGNKIIKVNAEIVGGNSGSPILSADGRVAAVATYLLRGDNGRDWTSKNTQFDDVRRFGLRINDVTWVEVNRFRYANACAKLEILSTYWKYLVPYLICLDVAEKEMENLKLTYRDIDRKSFGSDEAGFHGMLMELSRAYAGIGKSWNKWQNLVQEREALINRLNEAIAAKELTLARGEKTLAEFDSKNGMATWENYKAKHRAFYFKRKDALLMAKKFIMNEDWATPLILHGSSEIDRRKSIDGYLEAIQYFLDQNEQGLKDLNKGFKNLEGEDED